MGDRAAEKRGFRLLKKFAHLLTRNSVVVLTLAVLLLIPSFIGIVSTNINYDILSYLPDDLESTQGETILEDTFQNAATSMLVVEGMPARDVEKLKEKIADVPNVSNALWISDMLDISVPKEILPDTLKDIFYSSKADSTMMIIQFDHPGASIETMTAIDDIRALCNEQCFLSGFSIFTRDIASLVASEMPTYTILAVVLTIFAMLLTMSSTVQPFVFIIGIGFAVLYNMGTNVIFGEISYITNAIAAILQLGVTIDYSIFLMDRYDEEKPKFSDRRDAMASAVVSAFTSLSGSSMTTVAGFMALCFMRLALGKDIGLVMAKGVIIGILVVVVVLPSLVLQFDKLIHRWHHRTIIPDFSRLNNWIIDHRKTFTALFLVLFIPAVILQSRTEIYYNLDRALPEDLGSIVATDKMKEQYNMASTHFIILDDSLPANDLSDIAKKVEKVQGIESVLAFNKFVGPGIPDEFIPQEIKDFCKKDGKQMMMVNSSYKAATDEENAQIDELYAIVKAYDPDALITGEGPLTKDLSEITTVDISVTNVISILAILLIVAICLKSLTVPVVLVAAIELSIFINQGIPALSGTVIPFICPIVIGCIQLGATVDYAILMTTRFREELRAGHESVEAMKIASNAADRSIITSALGFFCANFGVAIVSKIEIIQSICSMLARGAIISALVSIFILPSILLCCERIFARTTKDWRTTPKPRASRRRADKKAPAGLPGSAN